MRITNLLIVGKDNFSKILEISNYRIRRLPNYGNRSLPGLLNCIHNIKNRFRVQYWHGFPRRISSGELPPPTQRNLDSVNWPH